MGERRRGARRGEGGGGRRLRVGSAPAAGKGERQGRPRRVRGGDAPRVVHHLAPLRRLGLVRRPLPATARIEVESFGPLPRGVSPRGAADGGGPGGREAEAREAEGRRHERAHVGVRRPLLATATIEVERFTHGFVFMAVGVWC